MVILIKHCYRISNGRKIITKSYTVKPANEEDINHECVFPNPTYQDDQSTVKPKDLDVSPNLTYQDAQDNEFSVQLKIIS